MAIHEAHSFSDEFVKLLYVSLELAFILDSPLHESYGVNTLRASEKFFQCLLSDMGSDFDNLLKNFTCKIISNTKLLLLQFS